MKGPQLLLENHGHLRTRMGAIFVGERAVFRGHDLLAELDHFEWLELYVLGITGRQFAPAQIRLMHAMWVCTSYPDARLWNNRVAALAGTTRSTASLGVAAGLAVSEASTYGRGVDVEAIDFLIRTKHRLDSGATLGECVEQQLRDFRRIAGYGRPIADRDERIAPMMKLAEKSGFDRGTFVQLAFAVEQFLLDGRWRMHMNFGALSAAFAADLGLSVEEYYRFGLLAFFAGMPPCFIEAAERPEGSVFPLSCDDVLYSGLPKRSWNRRRLESESS